MKIKEQYKLGEAVKELYQTEPLRRDFAAIVADKAFAQQRLYSPVLDNILLFSLCFLIVVSLIYAFSLLSEISVAAILMVVITIIAFIGLSIKEHFILLKRIHSKG